jgi:hypothetical protein
MSITWGTITWYLFHTIAEKIKEESFPSKKKELLHLINIICNSLPCPECQEHAKDTLKYMKPQEIHTKDDFQKMLWSFHNFVNKRRGVKQFTLQECNDKYKNGNLQVILQNFYMLWSKNYKVMKLLGDAFMRNRTTEYVKKWMDQNKDHFDV